MLLAIHALPLINSLPARLAARALPGCVARMAGSDAVFLTFDDGPHPTTTPDILARLVEHGARATFFLLGERASRFPDLVRAIHGAGHTIGQHGDSHLDAWRSTTTQFIGGMERATAVLEQITGDAITWMRPPYGRVTPAMLRWARRNRQRVALWDVMPGDFRADATPGGVADVTLRMVRSGSIVVLHEGPAVAHVMPAALDLILPRLAERGLRCEAL